ncbi:serine/threonine-protein phosphatase [Streptomyces sp. NBC_01538]
MIRIKAGVSCGARLRNGRLRAALAGRRCRFRIAGARPRCRRRHRPPEPQVARRIERRPSRWVLSLALPTLWGAVAITYKLACPLAQQGGLGARILTSAVFFAVGTGLVLHVRRALLRELRIVRQVAGAAQSVLLRPLPQRVDGLRVAAAQLSADRGAVVGGDLYEVIATEYGVRVVMGDVRGHGIAAIGTVAAVLGSFREAVHDEAELGSVLRKLERALARHLGERARAEALDAGSQVVEEFVTVLLLEIGGDGELRALNCGHPAPYLLSGGRADVLTVGEPLPPLGPFPLPAELSAAHCGQLLPGEALLLHTDGVEDARDAHGRFFPLPAVLAEAVRTQLVSPQAVLGAVFSRLLRHAGGSPTDDVAVLVLRNDRHQLPRRQQEPPVVHQVT